MVCVLILLGIFKRINMALRKEIQDVVNATVLQELGTRTSDLRQKFLWAVKEYALGNLSLKYGETTQYPQSVAEAFLEEYYNEWIASNEKYTQLREKLYPPGLSQLNTQAECESPAKPKRKK